jgi:hypothetical protein
MAPPRASVDPRHAHHAVLTLISPPSRLPLSSHAYAKALRYRELELVATPSDAVLEALMAVNRKLGQDAAAAGVLALSLQAQAQQGVVAELEAEVRAAAARRAAAEIAAAGGGGGGGGSRSSLSTAGAVVLAPPIRGRLVKGRPGTSFAAAARVGAGAGVGMSLSLRARWLEQLQRWPAALKWYSRILELDAPQRERAATATSTTTTSTTTTTTTSTTSTTTATSGELDAPQRERAAPRPNAAAAPPPLPAPPAPGGEGSSGSSAAVEAVSVAAAFSPALSGALATALKDKLAPSRLAAAVGRLRCLYRLGHWGNLYGA